MLICGYSKMSLRFTVLLLSFSKMIAVGFVLVFMIYLIYGSWPLSSVKYGFYITDWALNSIKRWLVTPITFVPLLHLNILLVDFKPLPSRYRDLQRRQGRNLKTLEVVGDHLETAPKQNRNDIHRSL